MLVIGQPKQPQPLSRVAAKVMGIEQRSAHALPARAGGGIGGQGIARSDIEIGPGIAFADIVRRNAEPGKAALRNRRAERQRRGDDIAFVSTSHVVQESHVEVEAGRRDQHPAFADPGSQAQLNRGLALTQLGDAQILDCLGPVKPQLDHRTQHQPGFAARLVGHEIGIEVEPAHLELDPRNPALENSARLQFVIVGAFVVGGNAQAETDGKPVAAIVTHARWRASWRPGGRAFLRKSGHSAKHGGGQQGGTDQGHGFTILRSSPHSGGIGQRAKRSTVRKDRWRT